MHSFPCRSFLLFLFTAISISIFSQDSLSYRLEAFGSTATGSTTPFWISGNTYGLVPLKANNAYLRGLVTGKHRLNNDFNFSAGLDMVGSVHHSSSFFIQQLYGEISFQDLFLTIGQKEYYNSMLNRELSSGDFDLSSNAHPMPEIRISIPAFTKVPFTNGFVQVKGDFTIGKSMDNNYILDQPDPSGVYATDILWHRKSIYFLVEDPEKKCPFSILLGLDHAVQWGGWTNFYDLGNIPHSLSDFLRIVMGQSGDERSSLGDQTNALGNHQGTYNLRATYHAQSFDISAYKQHFFDDASGMEYANWRDGIFGLEYTSSNQNYLKNIVLEYIHTANQSGPMHFLSTGKEGARGGGNDDYYNHDYYVSGWSYWGRTIGNALITSPEYNEDGKLSLMNNRIRAIHLGLKGDISDRLSYRILATGMQAWGRMSFPFLKKKQNFSSMIECIYTPPKAKEWKLGLQLGQDAGNLYNNSWGCSFKISRSGRI